MQASAATLCVNQNPKSGCPYTTIGAAVAAAASGGTINVAPGRYAEDVHIIQPVSLIGAGAQSTIINAKGLSNGIFIDGINGAATITPGATHADQCARSAGLPWKTPISRGFWPLNASQRYLVGQSG